MLEMIVLVKGKKDKLICSRAYFIWRLNANWYQFVLFIPLPRAIKCFRELRRVQPINIAIYQKETEQQGGNVIERNKVRTQITKQHKIKERTKRERESKTK